jgi:hypothetical protein
MTWADVGQKEYVKYKECVKGQVLVTGIYLKQLRSAKFNTEEYEFSCEETGRIISLGGTGQLNHRMQYLSVGDRVQIIYDGKITISKGHWAGTDAHQFIVRRDTEYKNQVAAPEVKQESKPEVEETSYDEGLDDFDDLNEF